MLGIAALLSFLEVVALADNVNVMEINPKPLRTFKYTACNETSVPIFFKSLDIGPEPFNLGTTVYVNGVLELAEKIGGDIDYEMQLLLLVAGKYRDACGFFSKDFCEGNNVCRLLAEMFPDSDCPESFRKQNGNCSCPFQQTTYTLHKFPYKLPYSAFPVTGYIRIVIKLKQANRELMCTQVDFCMTRCS